MIIIKSTNGNRLKLTATRLTEIDHTSVEEDEYGEEIGEPTKYPFHTTKKDLEDALLDEDLMMYGDASVEVHGHYDDEGIGKTEQSTSVTFNSKERRIGCKTFDKKTFDLILKTMGLKKRK
jgi:hypothetical protein